ncbi:MAG: FAD binding domain-containing protein, partial [Caldilineaceae bacterium]|nr:FAD binding domain-containing protein [Caldilineaceae bacterium]
MRAFDYTSPTTIDETLQRLDGVDEGRVRPLAGGTDLLPLMKQNIVAPVTLVDIKRLETLPKGIEADGDGLRLGALTTLHEVAHDSLLAERFPLLGEAAGLAATPQLRNMATVGGNLLQRPRCLYYRNELLSCWLKGGDSCPAYEGQNEFQA